VPDQLRSARLLRHLLGGGQEQLQRGGAGAAGALDQSEHRPEGGHPRVQQGRPGQEPPGHLRR